MDNMPKLITDKNVMCVIAGLPFIVTEELTTYLKTHISIEKLTTTLYSVLICGKYGAAYYNELVSSIIN